jgi:hypothetical protein
MAGSYTAGSYTKNFGWEESYEKLHSAIRKGFSAELAPVTRDAWRERSEIADPDRELIPLNFFLHSRRGLNDVFIIADRLVERAFDPYNTNFASLALFAFHLAMSGTWHHSKWPDGRVAGWANEFIRAVAWRDGRWRSTAFTEQALKLFLEETVDGEDVTKRKVLTNYRYMLLSAGALMDDQIQQPNLQAPWLTDATQLFWDRQIFSGELNRSSNQKDFEAAFFRHDIHMLLGCTAEEGRIISLSTYRPYIARLLPKRLEQLEELRGLLAA